MQPLKIIEMLILLWLANGTPIIAAKMFGPRWSFPIDANLRFIDGRRLFGSSKTIRGIVLAVLVTAGGAALLDMGWRLGILVGSSAMAGDLFSSFLKRRLDMPPSSRALILDQVPESLLPLVICGNSLSMISTDIAVATALFFAGALLLSRVLFALKLRNRPY